MTAIRYKAVDSKPPKWLALYDIETPEVANSDDYNALRAQASDNEKMILSKLGSRSYVHNGTFTGTETTSEDLPTKYVWVVSLEVASEGEDDLDRWYKEEHMDLLSKVPGWKRGRRYRLVDFDQRGGLSEAPVCKHLTLHEFDNKDFMATPEFKRATSTEWQARVLAKFVRKEVRLFELYRDFGKRPEIL
ncbi:hypothetical protein B0H15DRAFT_229218 [Mycena belliarum]|uniref:Uncharacterized protein n=1 Tax=Mycena belliarum TaxID=1033014 RepID=A0AAD6XS07_9AGAR|nr:hypothetical protein B0H15DRAFT_229218 [Mycena belliae]